MKGDFTRNTFDSRKHYKKVLMQQGRVQLDADWNEQAALTARRDETSTRDVVGDCGGPADGAAFGVLIATPAGRAAPGPGDFYLSAGRYYVDGLQCELEAPVLFTKQPDRLDVAALPAGNHLLVLDVWSRHLTALDDDAMREQALGGPDTATRARIVWQVRAFGLAGAAPTCAADPAGFTALIDPGTARLTAKTAAAAALTDPCQVPENGGYTGLENQLYRVEIHDPSTAPGGASWKWSRENGSVVVGVEKIDPANAKRIFVSSVGADKETLGFNNGDFVELLDDANELESSPGQIAEVDDVDRDARVITLKTAIVRPAPAKPEGVDAARHPKLRRWEGFAKVQVNQFKPLEFSVQVRFDGGAYRTGHYWQIPARAATARSQRGEIEWPNDGAANPQPLPLAPRGIAHHFCKLGVVNVTAPPALAVSVTSDCRCLWPALTHVPRLFYVSGDGQEVMPAPPTANNLYKLPHPLIVGVANAQCLKQPAMVHFYVSAGGGLVAPPGGTPGFFAKIPTDAAGLASCDFHLNGAAGHSQQVTAVLLDADGKPVGMPLIFNANLSIAREVAYDPGEDCAALQDQRTVQDAIARLASLTRLEALGGDGQDAEPGVALANPIEVLVTSSCGPVANAKVQFTLADNNKGTVTPIEVTTLADGVATCHWTPDPNPALPTQELTATLILPDNTVLSQPATLRFTANLRLGHGGCCVTVGQGGEFADLNTAITTLKERGVPDICICLLPGDHEVSRLIINEDAFNQPSFNQAPKIRHLHIHGCGRASRILLNHFVAGGLLSLTLEDLCIYADELSPDGHEIAIQAIDVTIARCHLRQSGAGGGWVTIAATSQAQDTGNPVGQIHISDNLIQSSQVPLKLSDLAPIEFDAQSDAVSAVDSKRIADAAAQRLASQSKSARTAFVREFRKIVRDTPKRDPKKKVLEAALKRITTTPRAAKGAAPAPAETLAASTPITPAELAKDLIGFEVPATGIIKIPKVPTALVIMNANADTAIINNIIMGEVRIYGTTDGAFDPAAFEGVAALFESVNFPFKSSGCTLRVEGNTLTKVVVDKSIEARISSGLLGLFARMSLLDNTFSSTGQQWLAAHVISNGNHFLQADQTDPDKVNPLGTAAGLTFICIGTSSTGFPGELTYGIANMGLPMFQASANLIRLRELP